MKGPRRYRQPNGTQIAVPVVIAAAVFALAVYGWQSTLQNPTTSTVVVVTVSCGPLVPPAAADARADRPDSAPR